MRFNAIDLKILGGFALCLLSSACVAVGPNYRTPEIQLPKHFVSDNAKENANENAKVVDDTAKWWEVLDDKVLNSLIERGIQSNLDLNMALARLQAAQYQEAVVMGTALPQGEMSGGAARGTGSNLARGRITGPLNAGTNTQGLDHITQVFGFSSGWEIDLFGRIRREIEAARYDRETSFAIRNDVLISVAANIARAYLDMRGLQMELEVLRGNIETIKKYEDIVQQRFDHGITNELDLTLVRRQVASMKAKAAPLVGRISAAQYLIAALLGQFPEEIAGELEKPGMIPPLPEQIEKGLPLDLLRRRPDIHEAERQLAAATARVGVATANLFPKIVLSGAVGHQGQGLGVSPAVNGLLWSVGPSISMPLLDFGALDALVEMADLRTQELLARYKKTVINSVREVESAAAAYTAQQDRLRNLSEALAASQRASSLAEERYDRGLTDSLNVIDAQRQEYELQEQYIAAQKTAADQFVTLYKSLGGGWEQYQATPPIKQPRPAVLAAFKRLLSNDLAR